MSIVDRVSSQTGDKTERSNLAVAYECVVNPELLHEIAAALADREQKLVGDCAEVMTKVAEEKPESVAPYGRNLAVLLDSKNTRVRWEAVHSLALIAEHIRDVIGPLLPKLQQLILNDGSIIVRDYAIDVVSNYAKVGVSEAQDAYPILRESLYAWESRHAGHSLNGLKNVALLCPDLSDEIYSMGHEFVTHKKTVVQKAAKALMKAVQKM